MIIGRPIAKLLDFAVGVAAFVMVGFLAFYFINAKFGFISDPAKLAALVKWRDVGTLAVVGAAGLSFALKRNFILFVVFVVVLAVAAVFYFWGLAA